MCCRSSSWCCRWETLFCRSTTSVSVVAREICLRSVRDYIFSGVFFFTSDLRYVERRFVRVETQILCIRLFACENTMGADQKKQSVGATNHQTRVCTIFPVYVLQIFRFCPGDPRYFRHLLTGHSGPAGGVPRFPATDRCGERYVVERQTKQPSAEACGRNFEESTETCRRCCGVSESAAPTLRYDKLRATTTPIIHKRR